MPSLEHSLGDLEHFHSHSGFKLTTRCSIKLSSPHVLTFPFSYIFQRLEFLASTSSWVDRGHGLKISFQLHIIGLNIHDTGKAALMEGFGAVLCDAEIWSQLGLKACLVLPQYGSRCRLPSEPLVLSLVYHEDMSSPRTKLMGNVSPAPNSMRPPFGIPLIFVEHVYIDFTLSSLQTHPVGTQERTAPIEGLCTDMLFTVFEPQHEFRPVLPDFSANSFLSGQVQLPSSNENPMQSFATQDPNSNFSCRAHSLAASIHSLNWSSLGDVLPDANWQFSQNKTTSLADGIFFTNFIRLIDAGLRSMISRNITPVCEEIKLTLDSNRPKLAEIAPALFSPGYLQLFLKHAQYFGTISHTILMVHRHTKSLTLQKKISRLLSFSPDEYVQDENQESEKPQNASESLLNAVKVRLWRLVQSKLVRRTGVESLKSINKAGSSIGKSLSEQGMLDYDIFDAQIEPCLFQNPTKHRNSEEELMLEELEYEAFLAAGERKSPRNCVLNQDLLYDEDDLLEGGSDSLLPNYFPMLEQDFLYEDNTSLEISTPNPLTNHPSVSHNSLFDDPNLLFNALSLPPQHHFSPSEPSLAHGDEDLFWGEESTGGLDVDEEIPWDAAFGIDGDVEGEDIELLDCGI